VERLFKARGAEQKNVIIISMNSYEIPDSYDSKLTTLCFREVIGIQNLNIRKFYLYVPCASFRHDPTTARIIFRENFGAGCLRSFGPQKQGQIPLPLHVYSTVWERVMEITFLTLSVVNTTTEAE